jgi:asparagine synthase (glutamine-hydrolysing)
MCGFAGVVTWDEKYRVTRDTLEKMSRAIAHRGPDGEGYHLTREHEPIAPDTPQVGFAFRRLAILDPDPRSNQPFHIGPLSLVFNGEIYNFRDLKSQISNLRPDYRWRTTGDTEVLLMAYEVWREKCVEKLNGMFAFAVWDEAKKELFLARDRMGQKPLYAANPKKGIGKRGEPVINCLAFASELSAVVGLPWFDSAIRIDRVADYLKWGYLPASQTFYGWAFRYAPAGWWSFSRGDWKSGELYFDPNQPQQGARDPVDRTRELVVGAVRRQLVADVPLGCFLSGGTDSSIIVAAMKSSVPPDQPVLTFSIGFDDPRYDETRYAAEVARHLGTTHQQFIVHPNAAEDLPKLVAVFGEPFGDSSALPTHYLARETRQHVKVVLSGDGGDELFGGYDRYRAMSIASRMPWLRPVAALRGAIPGSHPKSSLARLKRLLGSLHMSPARRYGSLVSIFSDKQIADLIGDTIGDAIGEREQFQSSLERRYPQHHHEDRSLEVWFERLCSGRDHVMAALALDRVTYLPDDLLTKVDRCSMLHGLEVRSPFMDHELVQFAAGLTTDQLLRGGPKRMLREAFANHLPDFVFKRRKMGFAVPIGEWFRGELRSMLRDNLFASDSFGKQHFNMSVVQRLVDEHEQQRVDHSQRLYALLMLELWWQQQTKQRG